MSHSRPTSRHISFSKANPRITLRLARPSPSADLQANSKVYRSATITQFIPVGTTHRTGTSNRFRRHRHRLLPHRLSIHILVTTTAKAIMITPITTIQGTITRNTTTPATTTKTFLLGIALAVLVLLSACSSEPTVTVSTPTVDSETESTPTPIIIYVEVTVVVTATPMTSPPPTSPVVPTVRTPEPTPTITPATPPTRAPAATPTKLPATAAPTAIPSPPYTYTLTPTSDSTGNYRRSFPIANHRTSGHTNRCSAGISNSDVRTWHYRYSRAKSGPLPIGNSHNRSSHNCTATNRNINCCVRSFRRRS